MKNIKLLIGCILGCLFVAIMGRTDAYAEIYKANNLKTFRKIVYKDMLQRKTRIEVEYRGEDYKEIFDKFEKEEFIKDLSRIDDKSTSDDHDYMIQNVSYMKTSMRGISSTKVRFTIDIKWRETLGQLQYVNLRVADILEKNKINTTDSVYERIKLIHDYIVTNIEYDDTLTHENAYSALKDGISTCQGYSLLFYKMLTDAGIPCRYITGTGINNKENGPHGWNIVKIGDLWYNVDTTWDDPVYLDPTAKKDEVVYDYFLIGSKNYDSSHIRDEIFQTPIFLEEYIVSEDDFDRANDISITQVTLGDNSEITEEALQDVPEEKEDKMVELKYNVQDALERLVEEIRQGNLKEYIVKSYNDLDDKGKIIIILLIVLILLSVIFKIARRIKKKDDFDMMIDEPVVTNEVGGIEEMLAKDKKKEKAEAKAKKKAEKDAKKAAKTVKKIKKNNTQSSKTRSSAVSSQGRRPLEENASDRNDQGRKSLDRNSLDNREITSEESQNIQNIEDNGDDGFEITSSDD